jgi:hypothetical protein
MVRQYAWRLFLTVANFLKQASDIRAANTVALHDRQDDRFAQQFVERRFMPIRHSSFASVSRTKGMLPAKHGGQMAFP